MSTVDPWQNARLEHHVEPHYKALILLYETAISGNAVKGQTHGILHACIVNFVVVCYQKSAARLVAV